MTSMSNVATYAVFSCALLGDKPLFPPLPARRSNLDVSVQSLLPYRSIEAAVDSNQPLFVAAYINSGRRNSSQRIK